MTTDTDVLVAAVREAFRDAQPIADTARFDAALDALAAELERLQNKLNTDSQNFELECRKAELERETRRANTAETELAAARMGEGEAREWGYKQADLVTEIAPKLDKALAALREIMEDTEPNHYSRLQGVARAAISEIKGEYDDIPGAGQRTC